MTEKPANPTSPTARLTPKQRPQLSGADWCFTKERVPDNELVPCLLWEFLRESATARQLANDWLEWFARQTNRRPLSEKDADPKFLLPRTNAIKLTINYPVLFDDFIRKLPVIWGSMRIVDVPWQELPTRARKRLAWPFAQVNKPVFIGLSHHALCLNRHVNDSDDMAAEVDDLVHRAGGDGSAVRASLDKVLAKVVLPARALLRSFTKPRQSLRNSTEKQEALCIVVDWGLYDNNAIRKAFHELAEEIIETRPKGIKPRTQKGWGLQRHPEWRGKLNSLGRTRLYCSYHGIDALRLKNPQAYQFVKKSLGRNMGPTDVLKALSAARTRFEESFHEVLPFEKNSQPLCISASRFTR